MIIYIFFTYIMYCGFLAAIESKNEGNIIKHKNVLIPFGIFAPITIPFLLGYLIQSIHEEFTG